MKWSSFLTLFSQFSIPTDCLKTLCCTPFANLLLLEAWRLRTHECCFRKLQTACEATLWVKACWRQRVSFLGGVQWLFLQLFPCTSVSDLAPKSALEQSWIKSMISPFIWVSWGSCRLVEQRECRTEVKEAFQGLSSFLCLWGFLSHTPAKEEGTILASSGRNEGRKWLSSSLSAPWMGRTEQTNSGHSKRLGKFWKCSEFPKKNLHSLLLEITMGREAEGSQLSLYFVCSFLCVLGNMSSSHIPVFPVFSILLLQLCPIPGRWSNTTVP